jgi:hypothetical protein
MSDITRSNSLADLAARIKTEHKATSSNTGNGCRGFQSIANYPNGQHNFTSV